MNQQQWETMGASPEMAKALAESDIEWNREPLRCDDTGEYTVRLNASPVEPWPAKGCRKLTCAGFCVYHDGSHAQTQHRPDGHAGLLWKCRRCGVNRGIARNYTLHTVE